MRPAQSHGTPEPGSSRCRQLDPFALSPETTSRFWMLAVIALLLTWNLASLLVESKSVGELYYSVSPEFQAAIEKKIEAFRKTGVIEFSIEDTRFVLAHRREIAGRIGDVGRRLTKISLSLAIVLTFLALTVAIYHGLPAWQRRRFGIRTLAPSEAPRLQAEIVGLAQRVGLENCPELGTRPGLLNGLAIRGKTGPSLVLDGEPGWLESVWSDLHRVVALHELGHIANRDILNREIARAAWLSLSAVLVVAMSVAIVFRVPSFGLHVLRTAGILLVMGMIWTGLVRARELFADARVLKAGYGTPLTLRLRMPEPDPKPWSSHPTNQERYDHLVAPDRLFDLSPRLALVTGILLALVAGNARDMIADTLLVANSWIAVSVLESRNGALLLVGLALMCLLLLSTLIFAGYGISATLGVQVLRSSVADLNRHREVDWGYSRLLAPAAHFVIGMELGFCLTPAALLAWRMPAYLILFFVLMTLAVWVWLIQVRAVGRLVLGALGDPRLVPCVEHGLRLLAALQLAILMIPAIFGRLSMLGLTAPASMGSYNRVGHAEGETLAMLAAGSFVFLAGGLVVLALVQLLMWSCVWVWLSTRRAECASCGHPHRSWRTVRRDCPACGASLASWLYMDIGSRDSGGCKS